MENLLIPYQAAGNITANRVLVLAPHPDDEVFGCGGTIMRHIEQHIPVHVIIVTDGAYGVSPDDTAEYVRQRRNESIAAAAILGYGTPVFWQQPDRGLYYGEKLIGEISAAIHDTQADLIYAPSVYEIHPDHRALGMAALEAVRRCGNPVQLALYEIGQPFQPNLLLDISDLAARKMEAMRCFASQNARQRYDLDIAALNRYRTYTLPAEVIAAEAYILTNTAELKDDPLKLYQSEHSRQQKAGLALDTKDLPLVSVIIRSMNRDTLSDALDSIALQTYSNIEVVLVNAKGSGHRAVNDWCGRFPIRMTKNAESLHRSKAANMGLETAKGKYLIFLDDDDWYDADHIVNLVKLLEIDQKAVAAYSGTRCISFDNNNKKEEIRIYNEPFDVSKLIFENYIPIHSILFRKPSSGNCNSCQFDETFDLFEDWDFLLQLVQHGNFLHNPNISANYRIHSNSGAGVVAEPEGAMHAFQNIVKKWRKLWTTKQILDFIARGRLLYKLLTETEKALLSKEEKNNHLISELTKIKAELEEKNNELMGKDNELMEKSIQLNLMINSRSWRYTKPLRSITALIKNKFFFSL